MNQINELAAELWDSGEFDTKTSVAKEIKKRLNLDKDADQIRKGISKFLNKRGMEGAVTHANEMNIDFSAVDHGWIKTKEASFHFKNQNGDAVSVEDIKEHLVEDLKEYQPTDFPVIDRDPVTDPHMIFVGLTDIHLSHVATEEEDGQVYNSNIAVQRTLEGVRGLIKKASGFQIDKVVLQLSGDLFTAENLTRKTARSTGPFPLSEEYYSTFKIAFKLHCEIVEMLAQVAPVTVVYVPGNHDTTTGWYLSQAVEIKYEHHKDVEFINGPAHRKYLRYKSNALMVTHGDGGKESDLPLTFMNEAKELVSECKWFYCLLGHIHHRQSRDYQNVNVHYMRCVKTSDSWHSKSQYKHSPTGVEAHLYHPEDGRVAIFNHLFYQDPNMMRKQLGPSILK